MTKFKCKKCAKMVPINEESHEQICPHCAAIHELVYDGKWEYTIKGYRTRKCLCCRRNLFVRPDKDRDKESIRRLTCDHCGYDHLVYMRHGRIEFVPRDVVKEKCAWCGEMISMELTEETKQWLNCNEAFFQDDFVICSHCKRENLVHFHISKAGMPLFSYYALRKVEPPEHKVSKEMIDNFLEGNPIYQTYGVIHPLSVYDYSEINKLDAEEFFTFLEEMGVEIFVPLDHREINEKLYQSEFDKMILKEDALSNAGGASLSKIMGNTKAWKDIRVSMIQNKNCTCEICGYHAAPEDTSSLHVHEEWEQIDNIVTLKAVRLLCSRCHACKHVNQYSIFRVLDGSSDLVDGIPRIDLITLHLMKVNNVKKEVIYAYRKVLRNEWKISEEEKLNKQIENLRIGVKEDIVKYRYRIAENIPNREALIAHLKKKGCYQDNM